MNDGKVAAPDSRLDDEPENADLDEYSCALEDCDQERDKRHGRLCARHRYLLEKYGSVEDPLQEVECPSCGWSFLPVRKGQQYCSDECRRLAWLERQASEGIV